MAKKQSNESRVKVAEITSPQRGGLFTVRNLLKAYVDTVGLKGAVEITEEGRKIMVYRKPIKEVLNRFKENAPVKKITFPFKIRLFDEDANNPELEQRIKTLEREARDNRQANQRLESQLGTKKSEIKTRNETITLKDKIIRNREKLLGWYKKSYRAAQHLVASAEQEIENRDNEIGKREELIDQYKGIKSKLKGTITDLEKALTRVLTNETEDIQRALDDNLELLYKTENELYLKAFIEAADKLKGRKTYEAPKGLYEAKEIISKREAYLDAAGENSLRHLPKAARNAITKEWDEADKTIEYHKTEPLELLVRIGIADRESTIAFSVHREAENPVEKEIYDLIKEKFKGKRKSPYEISTIRMSQKRSFEGIKKTLTDELEDISKRAKLNITFYEADHKNQREDPFFDPQKHREPESLSDYVKYIIHDKLEHKSLKSFTEEKGIKYATIYNIYSGLTDKPRPETISMVAEALGVPEDKLASRIK